ncbi:MAG TPA: hypothetical protein VFP17_02470 [Solirubrobacterales bacterium]|nr:hypothetical protein [Solirubrobacterales bacterium]
MKRKLVYVTAGAAALGLLMASLAAGSFNNRQEHCVGVLCVGDNGGISPTKLPKHGGAPATARIIGDIATTDGSHPPALQDLEAEIEKTIKVDAVGLPTCKESQLKASSSATAKKVCGDALIGSGSAEVEVAFPEQKPFRSTGPLLLFNNGVHGGTTSVLLHAYVDVPAPTAVIVRAKVTRIHRGRYGLHLEAHIPKIAGGAGSATAFDLKIGRRYTYKGRKKSFLTASCPTGAWATRGSLLFSDQTRLGFTHIFSCTPQEG